MRHRGKEDIKNFMGEAASAYNALGATEKAEVGTMVSMVLGSLFIVMKLLMGIYTGSVVFIYSCIYAVCVVLCKLLYLKNADSGRKDKKRVYYTICFVMILAAFSFNFLMLIKEEISFSPVRYPAWLTTVFGLYWVYLYYLTFKAIKSAKDENSPLLILLRMVNLSSLIMNLVLLQQMVLMLLPISVEVVRTINTICGFFCGGSMFVISISMVIYGCIKESEV